MKSEQKSQNGHKKQMPSHRVFVTRSYEKDGDEKTVWMEIGVVFPTRGGGLSIQLHATPVDGRCVALPYEERSDDGRSDDEERSDDRSEGRGGGRSDTRGNEEKRARGAE